MKKQFSELSKRQQERVESEYHRMKPDELDETMSAATRQNPNVIRLPSRLVKKLKTVAKREGKTEYQTIVRTWIEERLQRETKLTRG